MNILVAPNSMKGSLPAFQFAGVVEKAFNDAAPKFFKIRKLPVADGGDDTVNVLMNALGLAALEVAVSDPLGRIVQATYGYAKGTAVIEMAGASGMKLLNFHELNPMKTSSYGTGQLIIDAIQKGANKIYIGIGGSATVDGGMGMLEALGIQFLDSSLKPVNGNGENLGKINRINTSQSLITNDIEIIVISDVDNLLLGPKGAARIFGPQKGATPQMVESLESNLSHYAGIIKKSTGIDVTKLKGGGAAGGISVAFSAFLNAQIVAGADYILDLLSIDESIQWADLVITGEGMIDSQTLMSKAPYAVAMRAKKFGKPVIGLAGSASLPKNKLFDGLFSIINKPMSLEEAIENVAELTYQSSYELALLISKLQSKHEL
ncbi:MAG: glycerate kinase [Bacteroidia bacterium]|nr:glycerate kinase [Bacteroidia bacterium]